MNDWKSVLKADPTEWLLEKDNSSVRYFTLTDILEKPENDPEVRKTKKEIMEIGVMPNILARQKNGGYWETPEDFYVRSKYKGTVWQLIILAELGADGNDERIRNACEFILEKSQDGKSDGFSCLSAEVGGGDHTKVLPCLTGNMVWSLIRFGFPLMWNTDALEILWILTKLGYKDKRMQEAVDLVISKQDNQGRWILETTFNGRFQVSIERKGKPSKWITLNALKVLKRFYS